MSEPNYTYRPTLSEVLNIAFLAERIVIDPIVPDDLPSPPKPSTIRLIVRGIARYAGFYEALKRPAVDPIAAALSDPSRPLTLSQAVQLGLRQG